MGLIGEYAMKLLTHCYLGYLAFVAPGRDRDDRGDVPGWVLVTVMSAGIVMALWGVAETELKSMLRSALNKVK